MNKFLRIFDNLRGWIFIPLTRLFPPFFPARWKLFFYRMAGERWPGSCASAGILHLSPFYAYRFIFMGEKCLIAERVHLITSRAPIRLGNHVIIGPDCSLITTNHSLDMDPYATGLWNRDSFSQPITLEDNVWLAARSIVLPGVTIGQGSVISAGSVVTRSIPPHSIVRGNPGKIIGKVRPKQHLHPLSPTCAKP